MYFPKIALLLWESGQRIESCKLFKLDANRTFVGIGHLSESADCRNAPLGAERKPVKFSEL
jgi:rRNA pseudouridine-1189 N-methylase Emg1 (Nep1/Mra1 family)